MTMAWELKLMVTDDHGLGFSCSDTDRHATMLKFNWVLHLHHQYASTHTLSKFHQKHIDCTQHLYDI